MHACLYLEFPNLKNNLFSSQRTLNPVFDECFEFGTITVEQCTQESAMIGFTVMDHDVITANDFAGEAFLSLNNIPGVSESIDNFHGLKPIDLVLMQQRDKRKFNYCLLIE
jgi:BAI1-associated protein 3